MNEELLCFGESVSKENPPPSRPDQARPVALTSVCRDMPSRVIFNQAGIRGNLTIFRGSLLGSGLASKRIVKE